MAGPAHKTSENENKHGQRHVQGLQKGPGALTPAVDLVLLQRAMADPGAAAPAGIKALQRTAGNQTVTRLLQAKLRPGPARDGYASEEDDRGAELVIAGHEHAPTDRQSADQTSEQAPPGRPHAVLRSGATLPERVPSAKATAAMGRHPPTGGTGHPVAHPPSLPSSGGAVTLGRVGARQNDWFTVEHTRPGTSPPPQPGGQAVQRNGLSSLLAGLCCGAACPTCKCEWKPPITRPMLGGHLGSKALVVSNATLTSPNQRVAYDIKWDASVVPGGTHLNQQPNQAGGWMEDREISGREIGRRHHDTTVYYSDPNHNPDTLDQDGLYYHLDDHIFQDRYLTGGEWRFRVRVLGPGDQLITQSGEAVVGW